MLKNADYLRKNNDIEISMLDFPAEKKLCHVYMEAQIFTPDSKHFIIHSGSDPHGGIEIAEHVYYRCDIDDGFSLHPMTEEGEAIAPAVSPDGRYFYYLADYSRSRGVGSGAELRRRNLDGTEETVICTIPGKLPQTQLNLGRFYSLSTISSDGRRLAAVANLHSGFTGGQVYGVLVFDLEQGNFTLPFLNVEYCNSHPQYSRSLDPLKSHDLMIQHNHTNIPGKGNGAPQGADIHLIADDGTNFRDLPFGRTAREMELGHQCWAGRSDWIIGQCRQWAEPCRSGDVPTPFRNLNNGLGARLFAAKAVEAVDHLGFHTPDAPRLELCNEAPECWFFGHFATDIGARWLIADGMNAEQQLCDLYLVRLGDFERGETPSAADWTYLADSRTGNHGKTYGTEHCHPFLSPDGRYGFFNSNETGVIRPYIIHLNQLTKR